MIEFSINNEETYQVEESTTWGSFIDGDGSSAGFYSFEGNVFYEDCLLLYDGTAVSITDEIFAATYETGSAFDESPTYGTISIEGTSYSAPIGENWLTWCEDHLMIADDCPAPPDYLCTITSEESTYMGWEGSPLYTSYGDLVYGTDTITDSVTYGTSYSVYYFDAVDLAWYEAYNYNVSGLDSDSCPSCGRMLYMNASILTTVTSCPYGDCGAAIIVDGYTITEDDGSAGGWNPGYTCSVAINSAGDPILTLSDSSGETGFHIYDVTAGETVYSTGADTSLTFNLDVAGADGFEWVEGHTYYAIGRWWDDSAENEYTSESNSFIKTADGFSLVEAQTLNSLFTALADAVRTKASLDSTNKLTIVGMIEALNALNTGTTDNSSYDQEDFDSCMTKLAEVIRTKSGNPSKFTLATMPEGILSITIGDITWYWTDGTWTTTVSEDYSEEDYNIEQCPWCSDEIKYYADGDYDEAAICKYCNKPINFIRGGYDDPEDRIYKGSNSDYPYSLTLATDATIRAGIESAWFSFTPETEGTYRFECSECEDIEVRVYNSENLSTAIESGTSDDNQEISFTFDAASDSTYYIEIQSNYTDSGYTFKVTEADSTDTEEYRYYNITIETVSGDQEDITVRALTEDIDGGGGEDVWEFVESGYPEDLILGDEDHFLYKGVNLWKGDEIVGQSTSIANGDVYTCVYAREVMINENWITLKVSELVNGVYTWEYATGTPGVAMDENDYITYENKPLYYQGTRISATDAIVSGRSYDAVEDTRYYYYDSDPAWTAEPISGVGYTTTSCPHCKETLYCSAEGSDYAYESCPLCGEEIIINTDNTILQHTTGDIYVNGDTVELTYYPSLTWYDSNDLISASGFEVVDESIVVYNGKPLFKGNDKVDPSTDTIVAGGTYTTTCTVDINNEEVTVNFNADYYYDITEDYGNPPPDITWMWTTMAPDASDEVVYYQGAQLYYDDTTVFGGDMVETGASYVTSNNSTLYCSYCGTTLTDNYEYDAYSCCTYLCMSCFAKHEEAGGHPSNSGGGSGSSGSSGDQYYYCYDGGDLTSGFADGYSASTNKTTHSCNGGDTYYYYASAGEYYFTCPGCGADITLHSTGTGGGGGGTGDAYCSNCDSYYDATSYYSCPSCNDYRTCPFVECQYNEANIKLPFICDQCGNYTHGCGQPGGWDATYDNESGHWYCDGCGGEWDDFDESNRFAVS